MSSIWDYFVDGKVFGNVRDLNGLMKAHDVLSQSRNVFANWPKWCVFVLKGWMYDQLCSLCAFWALCVVHVGLGMCELYVTGQNPHAWPSQWLLHGSIWFVYLHLILVVSSSDFMSFGLSWYVDMVWQAKIFKSGLSNKWLNYWLRPLRSNLVQELVCPDAMAHLTVWHRSWSHAHFVTARGVCWGGLNFYLESGRLKGRVINILVLVEVYCCWTCRSEYMSDGGRKFCFV